MTSFLSASISGQSSLQGGVDHNGNALTNRVTYGMPSSVGALGAQPQRSLTSMASGSKGQGGGGGFNGMGGGKMTLSGRQMMLMKEDSHMSGQSGTHGGRGLAAEGQGLDPVGENSQEYGASIGQSDGPNQLNHHPQDGPVIGGAFSPSRGTSPNHPPQAMRGQPTHPRFQGTRFISWINGARPLPFLVLICPHNLI